MNAHQKVFPVKTTLVVVSLLLFLSNTYVLGKNPARISNARKFAEKTKSCNSCDSGNSSVAALKNLSSPVFRANDANVPANDLCTGAIEVQAGVPYYGSTINATGDRTSNCGSSDNLDVWHVFTPTQSGPAILSLRGSNFDTTLAVYDQCDGTELACNDDAGGTTQSEITMHVDANVSYLIRVAGYNYGMGEYILTIDSILPPDNDDCANAIEVRQGTPYLGSTVGASGNSTCGCSDSDDLDVWHLFTPTQSGIATISLMGSSFDTTLAVYDQCDGTEMACNDNAGETQSEIAIPVKAGTSYLLRIAGDNHQTGDYILNIYFPPPHDECVNAVEVYSGIPYFGCTNGATGDTTSSCYDSDYRDIWHVFTPTQSGMISFSLLDSCFSTTMAIYDECNGTELACNDNANNSPQSEITMPVQAGTTYYIRVAGVQNKTGDYVLTIAPPLVPENDECINAIEVQKGLYEGTTHQSTGTISSSCALSDDRDVWYLFTPTESEPVTISLWGSSFDTTLAVYDQCDGTELACSHDANDTYYSLITMPVDAGTSYMIRIAGFNHRTGDYTMTISSAVSADECADAIEVQAGIPYHGNTFSATGNSTSNCSGSDVSDVWHVYTPIQSSQTTFSLIGSSFDTTLAIYDQCGGTELACNDDAGGTRQSEITMHVDANTPYLIRIAGYSYKKGYYLLTIDPNSILKNDDCNDAIPITEGIPWHGSTVGATGDMTSDCSGSDTLDVWHVFTPTKSDVVTISLMGSSFDTTLAVYDQCGGTELACNDDAGDTRQSEITMPVDTGTSYLIRVAGYDYQTGLYVLTVAANNPPQNDECGNAIEITEGIPWYGSTQGATGHSTGVCSDSDDLDVWHVLKPTQSGMFTVRLYADFDSTLAVFDQCYGIELACNDDTCNSAGSEVVMHMIENTSYLLRVAGYNNKSGEYVIEAVTNPLLATTEPNTPFPSDGALNVSAETILLWNDPIGLIPPAQNIHSNTRIEVVYGTDSRQEEYQMNDLLTMNAGDATAVLVPLSALTSNSDGSYTLSDQTLAEQYLYYTGNPLCPNEPYRDQPAPGFCSGFLVAPDMIATAGHCVACSCELSDVAIVFGFVMQDANTPTLVVPDQDVYFIQETIALQMGHPDWALVRLDRPVIGHTPLPLRQNNKVIDYQSLAVIGYPMGIPRKYDLDGSVQDNTPVTYFQADIDTYEGNSGSVVLNVDTMKVEGIVVRGLQDFTWDQSQNCDRSNVLPDDNGNWEDVTRITALSPLVPSYDVFLGIDPADLKLVQSGTPLAEFVPVSLQPMTKYYWQIIARGSSGEKPGPIWEFTTGQ